MTTQQKVNDLAAKLGATVEVRNETRHYEVLVQAPRGFHWAEGIHELVASTTRGPWGYEDLWKDTLDRMAQGTEPCTSECEWWEDDG